MTRVTLLAIAGGLLLLTATLPAGGWAVSTVEHVPDYAVAGTPLRLTFAIRQHGVTPATGLDARVEGVFGSRLVSAKAEPATHPGRYSATITMPSAGDWTMAVGAWSPSTTFRWGETRFTLPVIEPGRIPPPVDGAHRGARLFAAKGCVSCHRHEAVTAASMSIGPALTGRAYPPEVLGAWLEADRACTVGWACMPVFDLTSAEIAALAAFFHAPAPVRAAEAR
jgi:hypothetical protein